MCPPPATRWRPSMAAEQSPSRRHEAASANPRAGVGRAVPRTCVGRDATARGWVDRGAIRCVPGECKDHPVEAVCGGPTARLDKSEAMGCRRRGLTCLAGGGQRGPASQGDTEHCLHGRAASLLRFLGCGPRRVGGDDFVCEATLGGVTASPRCVCGMGNDDTQPTGVSESDDENRHITSFPD